MANVNLVDLEPCWLAVCDIREDGVTIESHRTDATREEADGIFFLCPKCFVANGGNVGTHGVICWFEGRVPDDRKPGPGRWNPVGDSFANLSFVPGKKSHSVALLSGCKWHGFVTNGVCTDA